MMPELTLTSPSVTPESTLSQSGTLEFASAIKRVGERVAIPHYVHTISAQILGPLTGVKANYGVELHMLS
jgi:hypothetical protein